MKRNLSAMMALGAALALGACADYGYGGGGYAGYGYGRYAGGYGYDAYYDGFYGPYWGGYWGPDGVFVYSSRSGGPLVRDEARHFRRDSATGFTGVRSARGMAPRPEHRPG